MRYMIYKDSEFVFFSYEEYLEFREIYNKTDDLHYYDVIGGSDDILYFEKLNIYSIRIIPKNYCNPSSWASFGLQVSYMNSRLIDKRDLMWTKMFTYVISCN